MSNWRSLYRCAFVVTAALVITTPPAAEAAELYVPAGGNLQAAIDAAQPGDTILLEPGATYVGNFRLPMHGGTDYITIRSAASDSLLPPAGSRITPAYSPHLPRIKSPNTVSALRTEPRAAYWRLLFLELQANERGSGNILSLGDGGRAQNSLDLVPHHLVVDRVWVRGDRLDGQKRGIALNSGDTTIVNSYVTDINAIGQDSQAIGGWNGPGPYRIENNFLEGGTEVFLLGGDDPKIPGLTPTDVVFRRNVLTRKVSWRAPIVPTPDNVRPSIEQGGSLAAGTYAYRVVARRPAATTTARSAASPEIAVTVGAGSRVTLTWDAVPDATEYWVYGRAPGAQNMYWKVSAPAFTDDGASVGIAGTPSSSGTVWQVKNLFELKNARRVQVDHNVMENNWNQAQSGVAVLLTPRNQYGGCTWCGVQDVVFEYNVVRHTGAGIKILGYDDNYPSLQTSNIVIRHNEFSDVSYAWGGNGYFLLLTDSPRHLTVDHNTIISPRGRGVIAVSGGIVEQFVFTNNVARHNSYGIQGASNGYGNSAIAAYLPGSVITRNVLAGGSAGRYPAGNLFPTLAEFESHFTDYAASDFTLAPNTDWENAGTDGLDLGADMAEVLRLSPTRDVAPLRVLTTALSGTTEGELYTAALEAEGGFAPYTWAIIDGALPAGLTLDGALGTIAGVAAGYGEFPLTIRVTDGVDVSVAQPLILQVARAVSPVALVTADLPHGTVGTPYAQALDAAGGLGTYTWSVTGGALPAGLTLSDNGVINGIPTVAASTGDAFEITVLDAADASRYASRVFAIAVAPAPVVPVPEPTPAPAPAAPDVVIYALQARRIVGDFLLVADPTAAGGQRLWNPNRAVPKTPVSAAPANYVEFTFEAEAGRPYHLWVRGMAERNSYHHDSVWVQFSNVPEAAIGTSSAMAVILEDTTHAVMSGWGWQDNGYSGMGEPIVFAQGGRQTIRIQPREDGLSIDQIVLSPERYLSDSPGALREDVTILAPTELEVVVTAAQASRIAGDFQMIADATAADGQRLWNPNRRVQKVGVSAEPVSYAEFTFYAVAGRPYHLWLRGVAENDSYSNDSVWVQFSNVADAEVGTASAMAVILEDDTHADVAGWGWQDNAYGGMGTPVVFARDGVQTIRIQPREDGLSIDQIVLSPERYLTTSPGALKNDTTILPE